MSFGQSEETTRTIDKTKFVVVSKFLDTGSTIKMRLERLLEREGQRENNNHTLDKVEQTEYNKNVNTV